MGNRLAGKVAVITGGASGIGLGAVELFVAEGADVIVADIQDDKAAKLEERFRDKLLYTHCDVTSEADLARVMTLARDAFGGLDILFNNAGVSDGMRSLATIDAEQWSWIFDLLVRGPALGMKHAIPFMPRAGGGSIINTASVAGLQAGFGPIAYSSAKASVIHMSRLAAAQLSPQGIRVNAICPGLTATSIFGTSRGLSRAVADQMADMLAHSGGAVQPIGRPGLPSDIAEAALYLASDAAAFVTGVHLVVDGGITIGARHSWDPDVRSPFQDLLEPQQSPEPARADGMA